MKKLSRICVKQLELLRREIRRWWLSARPQKYQRQWHLYTAATGGFILTTTLVLWRFRGRFCRLTELKIYKADYNVLCFFRAIDEACECTRQFGRGPGQFGILDLPHIKVQPG